MARIETMHRRLDRVHAATGGDKIHVVWRDQRGNYELPPGVDPDDDNVLIIGWQIDGNPEPPPPAA